MLTDVLLEIAEGGCAVSPEHPKFRDGARDPLKSSFVVKLLF
jgi:hypothetical protein